MGDELRQIDGLTKRFFQAFDNTVHPADLTVLYDLLISEAVIINTTPDPIAVYSPSSFIPPRQEMFDTGKLQNFKEWEISSRTVIKGRVAHRQSVYGKTGSVKGEAVNMVGHKSIQFVNTDNGWKISALSWWDDTKKSAV